MVDLWGIEFDLHELILTQLEHGTFCKSSCARPVNEIWVSGETEDQPRVIAILCCWKDQRILFRSALEFGFPLTIFFMAYKTLVFSMGFSE